MFAQVPLSAWTTTAPGGGETVLRSLLSSPRSSFWPPQASVGTAGAPPMNTCTVLPGCPQPGSSALVFTFRV